MERYFLDKRILVNGRKSHIYLDNFIDLATYIRDVVAAYPPYTFQNGLTESPAFTVEWGGNLIRSTIINGQDLYQLRMLNLNGFGVTASLGNVSILSDVGNVTLGAANTLLLRGNVNVQLQTPLFGSKIVGSVPSLRNITSGQIEYTDYALPLTDGAANQYLATDGLGTVGWTNVVNKCEVLHFDDNPGNVTFTDNGSGFNTASTYSLPSNTLSIDGSYLEVEAIQVVTGTLGDVPKLAIAIPGLVRYLKAPLIHSFTHIAKGKIFRVSTTSVYLSIEGNIYDVTGEHVTSYYEFQTAAIAWNAPVTINCNFDIGTGDHVSELQHFVITKFLK